MGVTELAGAYPTAENKAREERWGWVGGVGCCWSAVAVVVVVLEEGCREPQLKRGHFSPAIALCGSSPRGSVTAAEARRCYDAPSQKSSAKMPNAADENLTYCPKTSGGEIEAHNSLPFFFFFVLSMFPKPDFKFTVYFPRW